MLIKESIGKLALSRPVKNIISHIQQNGIEIIDITHEHTLKISELEYHHRDPFDRLIIAQSICLELVIVGKDLIFDEYPIKRLW